MSTPRRTKKEAPWLAERRRDIDRASERLGSPENRCRWILDEFTTRDPDTLTRAERAIARDNLMAIVIGTRPTDYLREGGTAQGWRWLTLYEGDPLDEELRELWQRVVKLTDAHRQSELLPPLTGGLVRVPAIDDESAARTPYIRLARSYRAEDFKAALLHAVADLLIGCERLRECDVCNRLFVANRRQERHRACARRRRDKRWNEKRKGKTNG